MVFTRQTDDTGFSSNIIINTTIIIRNVVEVDNVVVFVEQQSVKLFG